MKPIPFDKLKVVRDFHTVLKQFHLKSFPPYDRALTKLELQKLLVLPPAEVPNSGMFDVNGKWNRQKALRVIETIDLYTYDKLRKTILNRSTYAALFDYAG